MNIKDVKLYMNKIVYYDTGQINIEGCSVARSVSPDGDTM